LIVKLVLEYDGTELSGWQRQDNAPTVQEHLERALTEMTRAPVTVAGASRTDAGVHALGQVASFETGAAIPLHGFRRGLNALLPPAIAVVDASEAPPGFHARFSSRGKHYRYRVLARQDRAPLERRTAWHRPYPIDVDAMRAAAAHLVGEHDFSAFRAAGCTAKHAVRRLDRIDIARTGDVITIDVRGNAFVRNMVRIIAGTLVTAGEGRTTPAAVAAALASRDREQAGQTAPACGLTLVEVFYED
jgi:tRNA pseudouridine38-40 synthase